jgi:hypothetical protein
LRLCPTKYYRTGLQLVPVGVSDLFKVNVIADLGLVCTDLAKLTGDGQVSLDPYLISPPRPALSVSRVTGV